MTREDAIRAHWQCVKAGDLPQFVIYHSPLDHPGKYVVRLWLVGHQSGPTNYVAVVDTLEAAREIVPPQLFCMPRQREDDPVIVEVWF